MKTVVSKFSKFCKSISSEWLTALLTVLALAAVLPRVGKVWHEDEAVLWMLFFPMLLMRNLAQLLEIPAERGMIVLLLLGTPLLVLYWCAGFWGVNKILRLVTSDHFRR
ncbi:MAG: hypothetical protein AAB558_01780 [Patescibacteria group bacterium]